MKTQPIDLPRSDRWLINGFQRYFLPRYLRQHFHVVAANCAQLSPAVLAGGSSMVVYANHASWWDPLIAIFLRSRLMPEHCMYAPIDAAALERYKIFQRMGFYGIEQGSARGSVEFLRRSTRIAQAPLASLWLTPEGKFCDVRQLDAPFMPGLAHLAHKISTTERAPDGGTNYPPGLTSRSVWFLPVAIEYSFWEERLPECLAWFGQPIEVTWNRPTGWSKDQWNARLAENLRTAQRELAAASVARDTKKFRVLLSGAAGSWSVYDWSRKMMARLRGRRLSLEHSQGLWPAE